MSTSAKKILFVGGGSGGHFYPLIAIAEATREAMPDAVRYYAGPDRYDEATLKEAGLTYMYIPAGKHRKYRSIKNIFDVCKSVFGLLVALVRLFILYPDVVVSKGGYTSVPIILASIFLRIPIVIHESDMRMGSANRIAMRFAHDVILSHEELAHTLRRARVHVFGTPVRRDLLNPPTQNALASFNVDPNRPLLFVIGGSQGAHRINQLILSALNELLPTYSIIHQTGVAHYDECALASETLIPDAEQRQHYHPMASLTQSQMNDAYHISQIVISRAGSNSIYEIALHAKPSIIIPIPEEISHDQRTNAYSYARTGAAVVIEEHNLSDHLLRSEIDRIMQDETVYDQMSASARAFGKTDAAERISSLIAEIAQKH